MKISVFKLKTKGHKDRELQQWLTNRFSLHEPMAQVWFSDQMSLL